MNYEAFGLREGGRSGKQGQGGLLTEKFGDRKIGLNSTGLSNKDFGLGLLSIHRSSLTGFGR